MSANAHTHTHTHHYFVFEFFRGHWRSLVGSAQSMISRQQLQEQSSVAAPCSKNFALPQPRVQLTKPFKAEYRPRKQSEQLRPATSVPAHRLGCPLPFANSLLPAQQVHSLSILRQNLRNGHMARNLNHVKLHRVMFHNGFICAISLIFTIQPL